MLVAAAALISCAAASAQTVKTTIALPGLPERVAVNYVTNRIYVTVPSFGGPTDSLVVIDGKTDRIIQTISIPPIGFEVKVDLLTNHIYVAGCYTDQNENSVCEVAAVNGFSDKVERTVPITSTPGNGIQGLAINPITSAVYVANASDNVVDVFYWGSSTINKTINLDGASPYGMAVDPFRRQLYVTLGNNQVAIVNSKTNTLINTVTTTGASDVSVSVDELTGNVFVPDNSFGPSTLAILTSAGAPVATVKVGNTPFGVDVDPFTKLAFVANTQDGTVSVVNTATNAVNTTVPVNAAFVALNPFTEKVYVADQDATVTVLTEK
ncbi:MAG TPA: YncE family protein, partial [Acidobacteriaceae bacterium]